jgi:hypothetical protein
MREPVIVPSIGSREVALAQRSGVRHGEYALQPLDLSNGRFCFHPAQYLTEKARRSIRSGTLRDRDCGIVEMPTPPP